MRTRPFCSPTLATGPAVAFSLALVLILVSAASPADAAEHAVRAPTDCVHDGDGSSWACAASNGAAGAFIGLPSQLRRGDVYFVAGGSYPPYTLTTPAAGTQLVSIVKATIPRHGPSTGWSDSFARDVALWQTLELQVPYVVFDGATGGGARSFTSGHGFRFEGDPLQTFISTSATIVGITIRHTAFSHRGDRTVRPTGDVFKNVGTIDDFEFAYNYVHHISGLALFMRGGSRWLIEQNYIDDVCFVSITDPDWHCEHLVVHGADDLVVRYNVMRDGRSTGILVNNDSDSRRWKIYGNVFANEQGSGILSVAADPADQSNEFVVVNNLFMGAGGATLKMGSNNHLIYNNIFFATSAVTALPAAHDYNLYSQVGSIRCDMGFAPHENGDVRYPNDCDALRDVTIPFVDPAAEDFRLSASIDRWPGINLCASLLSCTASDSYDRDMFGNARGADGTWDRGPFELVEGQPPPAPLAAPTGLRIVTP